MARSVWARCLLLAVDLTALLVPGGCVVVHMQTGGVARGDSGLTWRGNLTKEVDDVSICFRVKVLQTRETNYVVSYSSRSSSNDIFVDVRLHQKEVRVGCCQDSVYNTFPFDVSLMTWIHLCLALDLGRGAVHFQTKGKPLVTQEGIRKPGARVTPGGVLMLGQDQDVVGGQTEASQSLHGYLGDLLIFDRVISVDEMTAFTTCAGGVDWDALVDFSEIDDTFVFGEATEVVELGYEDACSGIDAYVSLFPETRDFDVSHLFCRSLGGSIVLPRGSLENEMVTHLAWKYCKGGRLWLGLEYTADRVYMEYGTNNTVNYTNWDHAFRDDTQIRGVLYSKVTTAQKNWGISTRDRKLCTACGSDEPFSLRVRGLCADSKFDREFLIHGYSTFKPSFMGWKSSYLSWVAYNATRDVFSGYWKMVVADEPHIHAEMVMENRYSYPIGTHAWKIHNDICSGDRKRLKLTTCGAGMFTCDDGSCVGVNLRCDKRYDCVDFSDEERCNPVLVPEGYDKTLPPPFTEDVLPSVIAVNVEVKFIRSVRISEFTLSLDVRLTRRWRDGRLRFRNLRQDVNHNVVEDLADLWLPELTITGADDLVADLQERKDVNFVDRQDSPVGDDEAELDEDHLYSGAANDLVAVREWTVEALCHYDLSDYPFDTQRCPLSFLLAKYTSDLFVVRIDRYGFSGNRRHHEYQLRHISVTNVTVGSYAGQGVILTLRNQYIYYISAAYVPSALLLVISYLTYYFSMEDFQTRINVALTSLLVLATLFSELVGGLPKTSYLKLIDIWFLGCIAADFCMVVCLVLIHKQTREEQRGGGGRLLFGHPGLVGLLKGGVATTTHQVQPTDGGFTRHRGARNTWGRDDPTVEPGSAQGHGGVREGNARAHSSRLNTLMRGSIPVAIAVLTISYSISVMVILDT